MFIIPLRNNRFRRNPQWVWLLQVLFAATLAIAYSQSGMLPIEELRFVFLMVLLISILLFATAWALWGIDRKLLSRVIQRNLARPIDDRALRLIMGVAQVGIPSALALLNAQITNLRRQAIRALGHMPFQKSVFETLFRIAKDDQSAFLQDAAFQALDEIELREKRRGQASGLKKPSNPRSGDMGAENRQLRVQITYGIFNIFGVVLALYVTIYFVAELGSLGGVKGFVLSRLYFDRAAMQTWERCVADGHASPLVLNSLARLHAGSRDTSVRDVRRAIKYARMAVASDGEKNAFYLFTLAEVYSEAGMKDEALEAIDRALVLAPNDRVLKKRRQMIMNK